MTVETEVSSVTYTGNGATTAWPVAFPVHEKADLTLTLITISNGSEAAVSSANFDWTPAADLTGSVTYPNSGSPLSSSYQLRIDRIVDYLQPLDILNQRSFDPVAIELQFDRSVMMAQQLRDLTSGLRTDLTAAEDTLETIEIGATSSVPVIVSMAALQALTTVTFSGTLLHLLSHTSGNRTGSGFWAYDSTDTTSAHNGLTVAVDASSRRWKPVHSVRAPSPYEIIELDYFLSRYSTDHAALTAAHAALFNDSANVPALLECHGIQLQMNRPFLGRYADYSFGATEMKAEKCIANLHLKAVDDGYTWQTHDFMYSLAGLEGSGNLRYFSMHRPVINLNSKNLIGLHFSGYYHVTLDKPIVRSMGTNSIGIYSSKYDTVGPGTGKPAGTPVENSNHGMDINEPDIRGTAGLSGGTQIGIFTEDGDFDVQGGWLSFLDMGIRCRKGGMNTEGIHFSMSDRTNMTIAVQVDAPRSCSFKNDELDGCCYYFSNPTDNMFTEGSSLTSWSQIVCEGFKSTAKTPGGTTAGFGVVNFRTITATESINGLKIAPDWAFDPGSSIDVIMFLTSGAGSWDGENFNDVVVDITQSNAQQPGTWPAGVRQRLAKTTTHGVRVNLATGAIEMTAPSQSGDVPFMRPNGKSIQFGREVGGVVNVLHEILPTGQWGVEAFAATAVAGAVTLNQPYGTLTSEALTTGVGLTYTMTLTSSAITAGDMCFFSVADGTNTGGLPMPCQCFVATGSIIFKVRNNHAAAPFNGTIKIYFETKRPA